MSQQAHGVSDSPVSILVTIPDRCRNGAAGAESSAAGVGTRGRIADNAPLSVRQAKKSLDRATELDRATGYAFEIEAYNRTVVTQDRQEGINAFNEKRKPRYKGQ